MDRNPDRIFDEYLVLECQGGSRAALEALARRWTPRLLRYASRTLRGTARTATSATDDAARDVVQDTWIGAIRGLGRLEDPAAFPAWVYAIAQRKCMDWIRASSRRRRLAAAASLDGINDTPADARTHDALDLAAAIAHLPHAQRAVVHLYYGEDLGIDDIATVLGIPAGTVKSRLHHAREVLRQQLGEAHERT